MHALNMAAPKAAILALALSLAAPVWAQVPDWRAYSNEGFGYGLDVPHGLLAKIHSSEDGAIFADEAAGTRLTAFAAATDPGRAIEAELDTILGSGRYGEITYRRLEEQWFVLSGYLDPAEASEETIFYVKVLFNPDRTAFSGFEMLYPVAEKPIFDPVVERVEASLTRPR